jgi:hypothetical protein
MERTRIQGRPSIRSSKNVSTMSSGTSTEVRPKPDSTQESLEPWQFFVLAGLVCATAGTVALRGQGVVSIVLLSVLMATVCLIGIAALRTVRPLVSPEDDRTAMVGQRTRAALEREKLMTLRAIKELEFDKAMGKLSEADWREMSGRLRARAAGLIRQLDAGAGYREQIEADLAKRLAMPDPKGPGYVRGADLPGPAAGNFCTQCGTKNEGDARFCKNCGQKL